MTFIKMNHRNLLRYVTEEIGLDLKWLKHNKKLYNVGELKANDRVPGFSC